MSAIFSADAQYLYTDTLPVTAYPFTFFLWFKWDSSDTERRHLMSIADKDAYDDFVLISAELDIGETVAWASNTGNTWRAVKRYEYGSSGVWYPVVAVYASASSRTIYTTGGNSSTSVSVNFPPNADRLFVGAMYNSYQAEIRGRLAHAAVWDVALSQASAEGLVGGDNPLAVEASDLIAYWPLKDDANDDKGTNNLTNYGSVTFSGSDNPTVDDPPSPPASQPQMGRRIYILP